MKYIECPHCGLVVERGQLYGMAHSFNIQRDEYTLKCPSCHELFMVGYWDYYDCVLEDEEHE